MAHDEPEIERDDDALILHGYRHWLTFDRDFSDTGWVIVIDPDPVRNPGQAVACCLSDEQALALITHLQELTHRD